MKFKFNHLINLSLKSAIKSNTIRYYSLTQVSTIEHIEAFNSYGFIHQYNMISLIVNEALLISLINSIY